MARGSQAKEEIIQKILETFPGSFRYDKELRIPIEENGENIQIKITLTAAKTNVNVEVNEIIPNISNSQTDSSPTFLEITEQEKTDVINLMEKLNL